jgi:dihydroflavonol-4-reductase
LRQALVTGATGFVGANVVRALLEAGRKVRVLVRPTADRRNIQGLAVTECTGDLRDRNSLVAAVRGCDEVYHVAADYRFWAANPKEIHESNVQGTRNLLEECLSQCIPKVVYTSTVGAIGLSRQPEPCDEQTLMDPHQVTSHYKRSKIDAENVALEMVKRGLPVVIVNPSTPIGPWDAKPTPTGKIIVDFARGKMPAFVETGLNFVDVRDVANGHILAAERGRIGERYILGNENMRLGEFLRHLALFVGRSAPKVRVPYSLAWVSGFLSTGWSNLVTHKPPSVAIEAVRMSRRFMYFNSSKAIRELGYTQRPIDEAIRDAVNWFANNRYFDLNLSNNARESIVKAVKYGK